MEFSSVGVTFSVLLRYTPMSEDEHRKIADFAHRARHGDRESIEKLFALLGDRIFRYLRSRTATREEAEDLTQTVFLEMIEALPRYQPRRNAKFSTWLFQIARFRLIDHYRKSRRVVPLEFVDDLPSHDSRPDPVITSDIERAMRTLPENYQTVLHLRFREQLPAGEIAEILHTSSINIRVIQHRALNALRRALKNHEPDSESAA